MTGSAELSPIDTPRQVDLVVERVAAVRETVGRDCDVAIDFYGRFSPAMTRRVLPLLEPYLPFFVEEPLVPELSADLARVVESISIPIATGERLYSRWDFRDVLACGIASPSPTSRTPRDLRDQTRRPPRDSRQSSPDRRLKPR